MEQTTLYYRQGSSDKVYHASITPKDCGYVVQFSYGRRGTALQTGSKTHQPVSYDEARRIYDKLVAEKTAKGYTPGEFGVPYQHTDKASQVSGILPQLLNPIGESEIPDFLNNPAFGMQEKFDGRRLIIRKAGAAIDGINRKGLVVGLPSPFINEVRTILGDVVLDGEAVGDRYFAFDALNVGEDMRDRPYRDRLSALATLISPEFRFIKPVTTATTAPEKSALLAVLKKENREGVVFKRLTASYTPGRPASGGDALKWKFYESATFIVGAVNAKRSVLLTLLDGGKAVAVGNVTIPPNHNIPEVGAVVEVRYLYAYQGGAVYQPVYLGQRDDIAAEECVRTQLKYKEAA